MKLLPLAAVALATLFTAKASVAQVVSVYDTITNASTAWYTTLGCTLPPPQLGARFLAGDDLTSPVNVCQADIYFVASAPGTYNVDIRFWSDCFITPLTPSSPSPVTIPPGGTFPSIWVVTVTASPSIPGVMAVSAETDSDDFVTCFDNSAAIPPIDTNRFLLDTNCDGVLDCATESYTFDLAWTNANMLMQLYDGCPLAAGLRGPLATQQVSVRRVDNMPIKKAKRPLSFRDFAPKKG